LGCGARADAAFVRILKRELIDFCRQPSAKSPYRTKSEIEQYLGDFQWIAAPLLEQQDITIAQRDFYFVSSITDVY
jgi:hypothetical protein